MNIIEKLIDLHKQATTERSHYYVANTCKEAIGEFSVLIKAFDSERKKVKKLEDLIHEMKYYMVHSAECADFNNLCVCGLKKISSRINAMSKPTDNAPPSI